MKGLPTCLQEAKGFGGNRSARYGAPAPINNSPPDLGKSPPGIATGQEAFNSTDQNLSIFDPVNFYKLAVESFRLADLLKVGCIAIVGGYGLMMAKIARWPKIEATISQ